MPRSAIKWLNPMHHMDNVRNNCIKHLLNSYIVDKIKNKKPQAFIKKIKCSSLVSIIFVLPHACCSINPCFICSPYIQAVQTHKSSTTLLDVRSIKQILEFELWFYNSSTSQYFVIWMTISSSKLITCALIHKVIIYNNLCDTNQFYKAL